VNAKECGARTCSNQDLKGYSLLRPCSARHTADQTLPAACECCLCSIRWFYFTEVAANVNTLHVTTMIVHRGELCCWCTGASCVVGAQNQI
jgi:hypothetical protein